MNDYVIEKLGHLGDGIAEGPIYVPGALPGECVTGTLKGDRLDDMKIKTPSADRVAPPCPHFKSCGGCQIQYLSDAAMARWKVEIVTTALSAHGITAPLSPIHVSPARSRRRATFAARRTKKGVMVGFYGKKSDQIVDITRCDLVSNALLAARPVAEEIARFGASRKTILRIAVTDSAAGLDILVTGGKPLEISLRTDLANLVWRFKLARLTWDDEVIATQAQPVQTFDGITVIPPPGAFLQATNEGEEALRQDVLSSISGAAHVVDLFSGCGTFSLPAARAAKVHAVEGDTDMTAALDRAWRNATGLRTVTTETRDLFRHPLLAEELARFDAAIIDPPRAGAGAQVAELARSGIPVIAYVSCNPLSFARDAATLCAAGYELTALRVVDQFRWSAHVELVSTFRSKA